MIHGISHGIGLAVHDPAQFYAADRLFKQGDAFTIEPGIYVSTAMLDALPDTPKNRAFIAKVKPVGASATRTPASASRTTTSSRTRGSSASASRRARSTRSRR